MHRQLITLYISPYPLSLTFFLEPSTVNLSPNLHDCYLRPVEKAYWDVRGTDPTVHIHLCRARIEEPAHER